MRFSASVYSVLALCYAVTSASAEIASEQRRTEQSPAALRVTQFRKVTVPLARTKNATEASSSLETAYQTAQKILSSGQFMNAQLSKDVRKAIDGNGDGNVDAPPGLEGVQQETTTIVEMVNAEVNNDVLSFDLQECDAFASALDGLTFSPLEQSILNNAGLACNTAFVGSNFGEKQALKELIAKVRSAPGDVKDAVRTAAEKLEKQAEQPTASGARQPTRLVKRDFVDLDAGDEEFLAKAKSYKRDLLIAGAVKVGKTVASLYALNYAVNIAFSGVSADAGKHMTKKMAMASGAQNNVELVVMNYEDDMRQMLSMLKRQRRPNVNVWIENVPALGAIGGGLKNERWPQAVPYKAGMCKFKGLMPLYSLGTKISLTPLPTCTGSMVMKVRDYVPQTPEFMDSLNRREQSQLLAVMHVATGIDESTIKIFGTAAVASILGVFNPVLGVLTVAASAKDWVVGGLPDLGFMKRAKAALTRGGTKLAARSVGVSGKQVDALRAAPEQIQSAISSVQSGVHQAQGLLGMRGGEANDYDNEDDEDDWEDVEEDDEDVVTFSRPSARTAGTKQVEPAEEAAEDEDDERTLVDGYDAAAAKAELDLTAEQRMIVQKYARKNNMDEKEAMDMVRAWLQKNEAADAAADAL